MIIMKYNPPRCPICKEVMDNIIFVDTRKYGWNQRETNYTKWLSANRVIYCEHCGKEIKIPDNY